MSDEKKGASAGSPRRVSTRGSSDRAAAPSAEKPTSSRLGQVSRTTTGSHSRPKGQVDSQDERRATSRSAVLIEKSDLGIKDRTMTWIMVIMGVLVVVGGIIVIISYTTQKSVTQEAQAAQQAADDALAAVVLIEKNTPNDHAAIIRACDQGLLVCGEFPKIKGQLDGKRANAMSQKESEETRLKNLKLLEDAELIVKDYKKHDQLKIMITELNRASHSGDDAFKERVKKVQSEMVLIGLRGELQVADQASADAGTDFPRAIDAYTPAMIKFREFFKNVSGAESAEPLKIYKELIGKQDMLVEKLMTPEFLETTPSRDMLAPKERASGAWGASAGCTHEFVGRDYHLKHVPVAKGKVTGMLSLDGWTVPWWDLVLDIDFEIVNGGFELFLRYRPDGYKPYVISLKEGDGYEKGKPHHVRVVVKGSSITFEVPGEGPKTGGIEASVSRSGGIAFGVSEGNHVIIKGCSLKLLRPR